MVAPSPLLARILGAVITSAPFFWASPRMIIWAWPLSNNPVMERMPGATFVAWVLRVGLLMMASILFRVLAKSPERSPAVAILETSEAPGSKFGLPRSLMLRVTPLPVEPPERIPLEPLPPRSKGLMIQSKPSSSVFSWDISINFVMMRTCRGPAWRMTSTSCSMRSRLLRVL